MRKGSARDVSVTVVASTSEVAVTVAVGDAVEEGTSLLTIEAETLCVHGDTPGAADVSRRLRNALESVLAITPLRGEP